MADILMADSVVSFAIENLSQLLVREVKLLYGVEDKVRSLHSELKMINVLLETSEAKKSKKKIEEEVLSQIRDVAHEAEDVIETFVANVAIHKQRCKLVRILHGVDYAKLRRDVAEKIDNIKATLNDIRDNKIKYEDFFQQESESSATREEEERVRMELLHKRRRNVEEDDVVGFVHESKVVIERLMEEGSRSNVVSIIGMGGLGKTTLARKVYNSDKVKRYFNCRGWVYVSNDCRVKEILLGLLKCLMPEPESEYRSKKKGKKPEGIEKSRDLSSLSEDELKQMVRDFLKMKRYLLVIDDLWKAQDWDEIKDAFSDGNRGSKILITSRLKEVASYTSQNPPYCLQLLSDEVSWELFSKRVFRGEECPSDLESLGKQIVKSCRGLPLSIIVLAGLLANKEKSHGEWFKVVGHVNWYLIQDETQVKNIVLQLSFDNLPSRLKPCFLYFGIFPEDFEIPVRPLLQQWIAEGFIQQTGTRYAEDVAEDYLHELIDRSLVQVARVKSIGGGVKSCRIHDLLRDLCISKSREDKVLEVCTSNNILDKAKPRRLSIHCSMPHYVSSSNNDHSCVRSLFCFGPEYQLTPHEWKWLFKRFKLVRVLDLGSIEYIKKVPSNLTLFIHLRYLRIHLQFMGKLPDSICTLHNLQTLDVAGPYRMSGLASFPNGIWKLKQLRHVHTSGPIMLRGCHRTKLDDEVMWNLQTISSIVLNRQTAYLFEKGRVPKLRKLGLHISSASVRKGELQELLPSIQQLKSHLIKLRVSINEKDYEASMASNHKHMEWHIGCKPNELLQNLQQLTHLNALKIYGATDLLTCAVAFPPCLTKLTLVRIMDMNDDGVNALGNLPELRILRLFGSRRSQVPVELDCTGSRFPRLEVFEMVHLSVQNWKLANGAMPCLQSLVIDDCKRLDSLPNELWSLTALRKVHVSRPSEALSLMLRNLEVKDGCELIIKEDY